ncbi:hypothetical protein PIB30_079551 [Stylosanthes scabra]|uniref:Uncharacterized protein n=1 Tax=Stylosanthes scabra TaxID=79078 RepID=A0ABU6WPG1_9FABA|nr:hypothetical protein [Stylosanthes scabra]
MIPTLQAKDSTYDFSLLEDKQGKMKKESLRSKERSLEAILARSPTHRHGSWRLCVLHHEQTTPRHPMIKPKRGYQLGLSTHRRRYPRICVDQQPSAQEQACLRLDVLQEA